MYYFTKIAKRQFLIHVAINGTYVGSWQLNWRVKFTPFEVT